MNGAGRRNPSAADPRHVADLAGMDDDELGAYCDWLRDVGTPRTPDPEFIDLTDWDRLA